MKSDPKASSQEVLAGLVERVTFHNAENGFCVLRAKARGHRDLVTVVGHDMVVMVAVTRVDYTSIDPKQAAEWVPPLRAQDLVDLLPGRGVRERAPQYDMAEDQALALANVRPASARADKAVDELPSVTKLIRIGNNARKMIVQIFALRFNLPLLITSAATPTVNARPAPRRVICRTPDARTKRFSRFVP